MEKLKKLSVWLTTIPLAFLLIGIIVCSTVGDLHSTLLKVGEFNWTGYSELRQPAERPDCEVAGAPSPAPDEAQGDSADDEDALLDDLFGGAEEEVSADAREAAQAVCAEKIAKYEDIVKRQDDTGLRIFVSIEQAIGDFVANARAFDRHFLVLVFIFCGLATTLQRQHLGLRSPTSRKGDRLSQVVQAIGNIIIVASFAVYYQLDLKSGVEHVSNIPIFWMIAFGLMALANIWLAAHPISDAVPSNAEKSSGHREDIAESSKESVKVAESSKASENASVFENASVSEESSSESVKAEESSSESVKAEETSKESVKVAESSKKSENAAVSEETSTESAKAEDSSKGSSQTPHKEGLGGLLLGIPLYAYMAILCGLYFLVFEQHFAGVATYMNQMTEHANLYTNVALYVFCGMMLKNTDIADKFLAILRPFKLSPELLVFVIVLLSALPTAYSGASGIFVIAAGAIIYRELKQTKTRDGLALAGTAMSGSMGIVLSPCLLVVIVAALNNNVTTDELFSAGLSVFFVNIFVFAIVLFTTKQGRISFENPIKAMPEVGRAIVGVLPYIAIGAAVLLFMRYGFGAAFDEYKAPVLLPFMLLVLLVYDRTMARRAWRRMPEAERPKTAPHGIGRSLFDSVNSTSIHSGGLLSLMTLSVCIGGIIDRANLNALLPQHFSSPFIAMALLFVILVIIGMIMDPYGAVILVSATLTQIAASNGIAPIHFWVTVLCAFELGYLTPPVALNQLLTRQVVGESAYAYERATDRPKNFWYRHERILLPVAVKGIVLLLVAFMPLIINVLRVKFR
ncbi:MAG: TRAP transporter large permease subunit [Bradymonadales bacterium]|nr:TRAP transporter large permease subunit [Bradymonadales bacterium]